MYIDTALNPIFQEKLNNLKNISGTFDIDNNQLNIISVDLKTPNNELLSNSYGIKKIE